MLHYANATTVTSLDTFKAIVQSSTDAIHADSMQEQVTR